MVAGRKFDRLPASNDCVGDAGFCGRQIKLDVVIVDPCRKHFRGHRFTFAIEPTADGLRIIIARNGEIVVQGYRLRVDCVDLRGRRSETQREGARLVRRKRGDNCSVADRSPNRRAAPER